MPAEQPILIELDEIPISSEPVEPTDIYLVIAWRAQRQYGPPYRLIANLRGIIEFRTTLAAAQKAASEMPPTWANKPIFHCRIGGKP